VYEKGVFIFFESVMVWGKVVNRNDGICHLFDKNVKRDGGEGSSTIGDCWK